MKLKQLHKLNGWPTDFANTRHGIIRQARMKNNNELQWRSDVWIEGEDEPRFTFHADKDKSLEKLTDILDNLTIVKNYRIITINK